MQWIDIETCRNVAFRNMMINTTNCPSSYREYYFYWISFYLGMSRGILQRETSSILNNYQYLSIAPQQGSYNKDRHTRVVDTRKQTYFPKLWLNEFHSTSWHAVTMSFYLACWKNDKWNVSCHDAFDYHVFEVFVTSGIYLDNISKQPSVPQIHPDRYYISLNNGSTTTVFSSIPEIHERKCGYVIFCFFWYSNAGILRERPTRSSLGNCSC